MEFQKYVTGQKLSMGEIRNLLGGEIYKPTEWIGRFRQTEGELRVRSMRTRDRDFPKKIPISRRTSMQRKTGGIYGEFRWKCPLFTAGSVRLRV